MKLNNLFKSLALLNFFILIIVFISCQTRQSQSKIKTEKGKEEISIDEEYLEVKEFFNDNLTVKISSTKMKLIVEPKDMFDFNIFFKDLLIFYYIDENKKTLPDPSKIYKVNDLIPSSKSGKIFSPSKSEQK